MKSPLGLVLIVLWVAAFCLYVCFALIYLCHGTLGNVMEAMDFFLLHFANSLRGHTDFLQTQSPSLCEEASSSSTLECSGCSWIIVSGWSHGYDCLKITSH